MPPFGEVASNGEGHGMVGMVGSVQTYLRLEHSVDVSEAWKCLLGLVLAVAVLASRDGFVNDLSDVKTDYRHKKVKFKT